MKSSEDESPQTYPVYNRGEHVGTAQDIITPLRRGLKLNVGKIEPGSMLMISAPRGETFTFSEHLKVYGLSRRQHNARLKSGGQTVIVELPHGYNGGILHVMDIAQVDKLFRPLLRPQTQLE